MGWVTEPGIGMINAAIVEFKELLWRFACKIEDLLEFSKKVGRFLKNLLLKFEKF